MSAGGSGSSSSARVEAIQQATYKMVDRFIDRYRHERGSEEADRLDEGAVFEAIYEAREMSGFVLRAQPDTPSGEERLREALTRADKLAQAAEELRLNLPAVGDRFGGFDATRAIKMGEATRDYLSTRDPAQPDPTPSEPSASEQQGEEGARGEADDEAFMEAWGSLKTYTLHAYSERYSPSIRHDGPNVRTYDADAVDALLVRLRPALASDTPEVAERPETCPTCGTDNPEWCRAEPIRSGGHGHEKTYGPPLAGGWRDGHKCCPDPFHTPEDTEEAPSRGDEQRIAHWQDLPFGTYAGANRYRTDDEDVLTIWVEGQTFDLRAVPVGELTRRIRRQQAGLEALPGVEAQRIKEEALERVRNAFYTDGLLAQHRGSDPSFDSDFDAVFEDVVLAAEPGKAEYAALRAPAQPDTEGEGQARVLVDAQVLDNLAWNIDQGNVIGAVGTMRPTAVALRRIAKYLRAPAPPQPVASEEDRARLRDEIAQLDRNGTGVTLALANRLRRLLTDATTLSQYAKERGE